MEGQVKSLAFKGSAGGFFVATIVSVVMWYVFIIGWPIAFNFMNAWVIDNLEVNGRKMKYQAGYGEVLGFLLVGIILTVITFGIYQFWFVPKAYRFVLEHSTYEDNGAPVAVAPAPAASVAPVEAAGPIIQ